MRIARVFPTRTAMSPKDPDAYFDAPTASTASYDEVHVSVTFTWDRTKALRLAASWQHHGRVRIGGPGWHEPYHESRKPFKAGMYLRKGVTITSRGCNHKCWFCNVSNKIITFDNFPMGNVIQDNNILACSTRHWRKVISMLKTQRIIKFSGGLEKYRITPKIAEDLRGLSIKTLYLACDHSNELKSLAKAIFILHKVGFTKEHLACYVLSGFNMEEEDYRMKEICKMGCFPFSQLYRDPKNKIEYSSEWKKFHKVWSRPAIIRKRMHHLLYKK